jgi:hypothetical protein
VISEDRTIRLDALYLLYKQWCDEEGRTRDSTTKDIFSRDLRVKVKKLVVERPRENGKQIRVLRGVGTDVRPKNGWLAS